MALAAYDFDLTSGGGTDGSWWTVFTRVCCGVNEHLVSRDTGQKRKILKRFFFFEVRFWGNLFFDLGPEGSKAPKKH